MIIHAFILSVLVGFLRKGRFQNLGRMPLRYAYLFVAPFALFAVVCTLAMAGAGQSWMPYVKAANIVQYALLTAAIALNLHLRELWIAGIGSLANFLAVLTNGGLMPVSPSALRMVDMGWMLDPERTLPMVRHVVMSAGTRLPMLADVIPIPGLGVQALFAEVASIGDVLVALAVFMLVQRYMVPRK